MQPAKGRPLEFAFDGRAANVNLRSLPAALNAPTLSTDVTANYHVEARGTAISGRAELDRSVVEGATIQPGTVATFGSNGPGTLQYSAKGAIEHADRSRPYVAPGAVAFDIRNDRIVGNLKLTAAERNRTAPLRERNAVV